MKFKILFVTCGLLAAIGAHSRSINDDDETTKVFGGLISQTVQNGVQDILARFDDSSSSSRSGSKGSDIPKESVSEKAKEPSRFQEETTTDNISGACEQLKTLLRQAATAVQKSFTSLLETLSIGGDGDDDKKEQPQKPAAAAAAEEQHKNKKDAKPDGKGDIAGLAGGATTMDGKATKPEVNIPVAAAAAAETAGVDVAKAQIDANAAGQLTANKNDKVNAVIGAEVDAVHGQKP